MTDPLRELQSLDDVPGALSWDEATRTHLRHPATVALLTDTAFAVQCAIMPSWSVQARQRLVLTTRWTTHGWRVRVASSTHEVTVSIRGIAPFRRIWQVRAAFALILAGPDERLVERFLHAGGVRMWSCARCSRPFYRRSVCVLHERVVHGIPPTPAAPPLPPPTYPGPSLADLPAALPWAMVRQIPRRHGAATIEMLRHTALAVFYHLQPSWSEETGTGFQLTTRRIPRGWDVCVRAGDTTRHFTVQPPAGRRVRRQVETALAVIVHGPTPRAAEDWTAAWGLALWECSAPDCPRVFRRWGAAVRHERWVHRLHPPRRPPRDAPHS